MAKLTRDQVEGIMGRLDDLKMAEIIGTAATNAELVEAKRWLAGYKRTIGEQEDLRPAKIDELVEILRTEEPEWYDT